MAATHHPSRPVLPAHAGALALLALLAGPTAILDAASAAAPPPPPLAALADGHRVPEPIVITRPDGDAWDGFGSVIDGGWPTWQVTAPGDDSGRLDGGAGFVLEVGTDGELWKSILVPSDVDVNDSAGDAAALDGDTVLLAGSDADVNTGAVWVFEREAPGVWVEAQKLTASDGLVGDAFGRSVALHGDVAFVGATGTSSYILPGSVYRFERQPSGEWLEAAKITPEGYDVENFGTEVELVGDDLAVASREDGWGAGLLFLARRQAEGDWAIQGFLEGDYRDGFGGAVVVGPREALAGAAGTNVRGETNAGAAYLYLLQ